MIRECAGRATVTLKGGSALPAPARPVVERPPALHASPKDRHHRRQGDQSRCGDARNRKFVDSPLEETVLSELVSEPKFPGNRQKYRDFHRRSLRIRLVARNPEPNSVIYDPIPYASEQGSYFGLAGK